MTTQVAGRHCVDMRDANLVLATHGRSFYWARHLLGAQHAARATRLYRFCRHIDDLADEAPSRPAAIQSLELLAHAISSGKPSDPLVADALNLMQECAIAPSVMLELIRGVRADLDCVRYADEQSLLRYCYQVAGTVGIMMCHVLDVRDARALRHAIDLGIGMQLTNISRDVIEDAARDRRYLPATLVGACEPAALLHPDAHLRTCVPIAVANLLTTAERYYQSGENGLHHLPVKARAAMLVAARLYRAIGRKLARREYDCWAGRTVVTTAEKAGLTLQALRDVGSGRMAQRRGKTHDATLHLPLAGLPATAFGIASSDGQ